MSPHIRKRNRVNGQLENNSTTTLRSTSSDGTATTPPPPQNPANAHLQLLDRLEQAFTFAADSLDKIGRKPSLIDGPHSDEILRLYIQFGHLFNRALSTIPALGEHDTFPRVKMFITSTLNRFTERSDASTSTESVPDPPKPTYISVACEAVATPPPIQPTTSPSPTPGSGPTSHSPKPRARNPKKEVSFSGSPSKAMHTPNPRPSNSKVGSQIRLVACIAGRPDALTSEHPRWKAVPTDCFSRLSKDMKTVAPGCTPLRFHCNQKGNLIITFTPTTPRSLIMSKLDVIRGIFELASHVPILFDTPRSTLHLANVPARSQDSDPIFNQTALAESILANPVLSALPLTSQPRWLRHPSKISGIRSSAVLTFEDPDGAIAHQLLKTRIFVFGQLVTVKPWINKPTIITRQPHTLSNLDSVMDSEMGTN